MISAWRVAFRGRRLVGEVFRKEIGSSRALCVESKPAEAPLTEEQKIRLIRTGVAPATGGSLKEIAADVWGHSKNPVGSGHRSGERLLRRPLRGPFYSSWYLPPFRTLPDEFPKLTAKQVRWKEKLKLLRAAGKGPPKKGEGKRSK